MADGKVVIDVILDDGSVAKGVADIGGKLGGLAGAGQKAAVGIGKIVTALGLVGLAKKGIDMVKASIDGAITRFDTLNQFPRVMQMIGFDAEQSEKAINRLSDGVQGLPTRLDAVASTAQNIAVMTGDLDGAVETTLALNNAFLASGASTADAERGLQQYVQMLSKGEVDLQSWRTLQETMGVALNQLAKEFGFTGESAQNDLYAALKSGEITFDEFNAKLIEASNAQGGFADMALTASEGIRTSWENIKTAVVNGVAGVIGEIDKLLHDNGFGGIQGVLEKVKESIYTLFDWITASIPAVANALMNVYNTLEPWLPLIVSIVAAVAGMVKAWALFNSVSGISLNVIPQIMGGILKLKSGVSGLFRLLSTNPWLLVVGAAIFAITMIIMHWDTIKEFFSNLWESIQEISLMVWEPIKEAWQTVVDFLKELWEPIGEFFMTIWESITEIALLVWEPIKEAWTEVVEFFMEIWDGLAEFFSEIWEEIKEVALMVWEPIQETWTTVVEFLKELWSSIGEFFSELWGAIVEVALAIWDPVQEVWTAAWEIIKTVVQTSIDNIQTIITTAWDIIKTITQTVWDVIKTIVQTAVDILKTIIQSAWDTIKGIITAVLKLIQGDVKGAWKEIQQVVSKALDAIKKVVDTGWNAIKTIISTVLNGIKTVVTTVWNAIKSVISSAMSSINSTITSIWNSIKSTISSVTNSIRSTISNIFNSLKGIVSSAMTGVSSAVRTGMNAALRVVTGAVSSFFNAGKDLIRGLADGIKNMKEAAVNAITGVVDGVVNAAKSRLKIKSPSRVFEEIGEDTVDGLTKGIDAKRKEAASVTERLFKDIMTVTDRATKEIQEIRAKAKKEERKLTQSEIIKIKRLEEDAQDEIKKLHQASSREIQKIQTDKNKKLSALKDEELRIAEKHAEFEKGLTGEKKKVYDELIKINDDYFKQVQEVNDKLVAEETRLRDEYEKTVDDRAKSLYSFAGIFDEIKKEEEISGQQLIDNLRSQVNAFDEWASDIKDLADRGINEGLLKELRDMGPKAKAEIKALSKLTEDELEIYANLWEEKNGQAREQAEKELIGTKKDTEKKINELHKQSEKQLDELQREWDKKIKKIRQETKSELGIMITDLREIGENSILGMIGGLESMEGALYAKAQSIADTVRETISSAFDIHSPSRWMRDHIGKNMILGWIKGIDAEKTSMLSKSKEMAEWMQPTAPIVNRLRGATVPIGNITPSSGFIGGNSSTTHNNSKAFSPTINNYFSKDVSSPSEVARKNKQQQQRLALEWGY